MFPADAQYVVRVLQGHSEGMPSCIVLPDGEFDELLERSGASGDSLIVDGANFVPLRSVKDTVPHVVYERAAAGQTAMWWK